MNENAVAPGRVRTNDFAATDAKGHVDTPIRPAIVTRNAGSDRVGSAPTFRYVAFDAVEIDLVGRRMQVAGTEIALEPKAFDVLALLVQAPGKAFARDEILDAVWGHRHVTPSVLNRAINLIRHALGDSAHVLHTLHGVGYRFDGEVRHCSNHEEARAVVPAADDVVDASVPVQVSRGTVPAVAVLPGPSPVPGDSSMAAPMPEPVAVLPEVPAAKRTAARRRRLRLAAGLVVLAVGLFSWYALHRATAGAPPPALPTLVVLPLQVIGDDKNETAFAEGLSEELTTRLARIEGLRLIASTSAFRAQHDGFDAEQLANRLHATHAIEGSLRESGDSLRIDLRLFEVPSGKTIWAQGYDRKPSDIFAIQQDIAQNVATALSLRVGLVPDAVKAPDPEVFREYLELRHRFLTHNGAGWGEAVTALAVLAARAPDFAPVQGLQAMMLADGDEGDKDDEAVRVAQHTLALNPSDSYAHVALGLVASHRHDWITMMKECRVALALNPSDEFLHLVIGMTLARLGYGEQALADFQAGYASDPLGYYIVFNLGSELDVLGRHGEAKHYLDMLPALDLDRSGFTAMARWRNAIFRHDLAAARAFAAQMPEDDGARKAYAATTEAVFDASKWPAAEAANAGFESKVGLTELRRFDPKRNAPALLVEFESTEQDVFGAGMLWAAEFAPLRHDPAFQDFLKRMNYIDYWNANGWPPQCKPEGGGARCS